MGAPNMQPDSGSHLVELTLEAFRVAHRASSSATPATTANARQGGGQAGCSFDPVWKIDAAARDSEGSGRV